MNVAIAIDQNVVDAINEARLESDEALERFVDARKRVAELEALRDLRIALGADVAKTVRIERLREAAIA